MPNVTRPDVRPCNKDLYESKEAALAVAAMNGMSGLLTAYYCNVCRAWHLTKKKPQMTRYHCRYYFTDQGALLLRTLAPVSSRIAKRIAAKNGFTGIRVCRFIDHVGHLPRIELTEEHDETRTPDRDNDSANGLYNQDGADELPAAHDDVRAGAAAPRRARTHDETVALISMVHL